MKLQKKQRAPGRVIIYGALFVAVVLIAAGGWWFFLKPEAPAPKQFGYQALKINGEFVSPAVFLEEQNKFYQRYKSNSEMIRKTDEERNDLLLEEIINRVTLDNFLLRESNIDIAPAEVETYIERYIKTKYSTPAEMQSYLASKYCSNEAELKEAIKLYLLKVKYFSKLAREKGVTVKAAEVEKEFQRQKKEHIKAVIKHILISSRLHPPQEALALANRIYDQLKNGMKFEELARQYSEDFETKEKGGELEPATKEQTPPEFVELVFNAKPGQIFPPVDTAFGYEIVKLDKLITFIHPREELQETMLMEEFGKSAQFKEWLAAVKSKVKIEIVEPSLKAFRLFKEQKFQEAAPVYEEAYRIYGVELNFMKAVQCYRLAQNWDKMLELCQIGYRRFPDKIPYYLDAAEALNHKGQAREALKFLKKAEEFAGDNTYLQDLVKQGYTRLGIKR
ncbi:MAG: peptidylprolyl isomerase [Firmicutes bacterium]|nr:peptidylprolyl isomerase [Bacillota bacterium]